MTELCLEELEDLWITYLLCQCSFIWCPLFFSFFFLPKFAVMKVENDPHLKLMYTECLRLCGTWLAETCLENPTVIMQKYLEKVRSVFKMLGLGDNAIVKYFVHRCFSLSLSILFHHSGNLYQRFSCTVLFLSLSDYFLFFLTMFWYKAVQLHA